MGEELCVFPATSEQTFKEIGHLHGLRNIENNELVLLTCETQF